MDMNFHIFDSVLLHDAMNADSEESACSHLWYRVTLHHVITGGFQLCYIS